MSDETASIRQLTELTNLRRRVKLQRMELRRLNRMLRHYWCGYRGAMNFNQYLNLFGKMCEVLGRETAIAIRDGKPTPPEKGKDE